MTSQYVAKPADAMGWVNYTPEETAVWRDLFRRQYPIVNTYACNEYLEGISALGLGEQLPQIPEINQTLLPLTGWSIVPVPALIDYQRFFTLLSRRQFPCATFIRHRAEMDYLKEPDIFHEVFGHCPLLTNPIYADFMAAFGTLGCQASPETQVMLARLYWFTVEFGLIKQGSGLKVYGGGILSSKGETPYAIESEHPARTALDLVDLLRTPYRIDIYQPIYFYIENFDVLYNLMKTDLAGAIETASRLGLHRPRFPPSDLTKDLSAC